MATTLTPAGAVLEQACKRSHELLVEMSLLVDQGRATDDEFKTMLDLFQRSYEAYREAQIEI